VNRVRARGSSGPAAHPFRALDEKAPNLRASGGCGAAVDAGLCRPLTRDRRHKRDVAAAPPAAWCRAGRDL